MWVWALHQRLQRKGKLWIAQMHHCPPSDSTPGSAAGTCFLQHNHVLLNMSEYRDCPLRMLVLYPEDQGEERDKDPGVISSFSVILIWGEHGEKEETLTLIHCIPVSHYCWEGNQGLPAFPGLRRGLAAECARRDSGIQCVHVHNQIEMCGSCRFSKDAYQELTDTMTSFIFTAMFRHCITVGNLF